MGESRWDGPVPGLAGPYATFYLRNPAGLPRSKDGCNCQAGVGGKQACIRRKPMSGTVLQWTSIYGQWNLNFIYFLHVVKCYSSFNFFQPWKDIKAILNLWLNKHRCWAPCSLQATAVCWLWLQTQDGNPFSLMLKPVPFTSRYTAHPQIQTSLIPKHMLILINAPTPEEYSTRMAKEFIMYTLIEQNSTQGWNTSLLLLVMP